MMGFLRSYFPDVDFDQNDPSSQFHQGIGQTGFVILGAKGLKYFVRELVNEQLLDI